MKKKILTILGIIIIIAVSIVCSFITKETLIADKSAIVDMKEKESVLVEIVDKTIITQTFTTTEDKLDGINLKFATYGHTCKGNIDVRLSYQDSDKEIAKTRIDISELKDNQHYSIRYDKTIPLKSEKLKLEIIGVGTKAGSTVTTYGYKTVTPNTKLSYSTGDVIEQTLDLSLLKDVFSVQRMIYLIASMLALYFYIIFVLRSIITKK